MEGVSKTSRRIKSTDGRQPGTRPGSEEKVKQQRTYGSEMALNGRGQADITRLLACGLHISSQFGHSRLDTSSTRLEAWSESASLLPV
jgi:hypothetical protein